MSSHVEKHPSTFQVPKDIGYIIENDLVMIQSGFGDRESAKSLPAGVSKGNTYIYEVQGRDDFIIRMNDSPESHDALRSIVLSMSYDTLADYGVNAVPYNTATHDDKIYVVTKKVKGKNLEGALKTVPSEILAPQIDATWKGLVGYMSDGYKNKTVVADDIISPNQFMYGRTNGDSEDRVWLVDLGQHASVYDPTNYMYEEMLLTVAGHIVELEQALGVRLVESRKMLSEAILAPKEPPRPIEESEHYKQAILRATKYSLENSVVIGYEEEDRILSV